MTNEIKAILIQDGEPTPNNPVEIKRLLVNKEAEDYITNLQEENEYNNYCNEELRKKITNLEYKNERLEEDNKRLKELCDKYEEEHSTTFNYWKQLIKEDYKLKCEKAIEYIKDNLYYCVDNDDTNLLNILKGSEVNE